MMKIPELNEGERYAGVIIDSATDQPTHHLILIPQQPETHLTWNEAIAWAASIGVELPTHQESALLYPNLRPHSKAPGTGPANSTPAGRAAGPGASTSTTATKTTATRTRKATPVPSVECPSRKADMDIIDKARVFATAAHVACRAVVA